MQPDDNRPFSPRQPAGQQPNGPVAGDVPAPNNNRSNVPGFMTEQNPQPYTGLPAPVSDPSGKPIRFKPYRKGRAGLLIVLLFLFLLGGGGAAAYYVMIFNSPEKTWQQALERTAMGYDRLTEYQEERKNDKGADIEGSFKLSGNIKTDGTFDAKWYDGSGSLKLDVGLGATRANLETRFIKSASTNPDIYLNVSGIKGLGTQYGSAELDAILAKLDSQWIAMDHTMLDNLEQGLTESTEATQPASLTPEDMKLISQKVGEALDAHIFTTDKNKEVFVLKQKVGKEKRDGRQMYHFKVGIDKQHLKTFMTTLKDKLNETKIKEMLGNRTIEEVLDYEDTLKDIDKMDTNKTADAWVDMQTKLFYAVRIATDNKPDQYIEFGTPYVGGDEFPFVFKVVEKSDKSDLGANIRFTLNTKANKGKFDMEVTEKSDTSTTEFETEFTITPRATAVVVEKPTTSRPLAEVLSELGVNPDSLMQTVPGLPSSIN